MAAPIGNKNAQKAKLYEQALKRALARATGQTVDAGLDKVAEQAVKAAFAGEKWAIEHVSDRLDGKAAQSVEHSGSIENRHVSELSREQLLAIAAGSSPGATEEAGREPEPTGVH
jgi:hypothetical protein